ncbi:MAG: cofactor-independent phosphoglycerate mutase [Thermodesulfobacteriota bacterium]
MKNVILIGDGMADNPIDELGGRTPLGFAHTPHLDSMASMGKLGLFATVPPGYAPGSDVANLSVLGYDPRKYYTGRAPLEAASIGVKLEEGDVAFRCNLVTLVEKDGAVVMDDYSAGHISTEEATEIIEALAKVLATQGVRLYAGTGYRHLLVWKNGPKGELKTTPPHDISDRSIEGFLPAGDGAEKLLELIELSQEVLLGLDVNKDRVAAGKKPASSIWLWGQGTAPLMPTIKQRFGVDGAIISAVDLMKGIGIYAGLEVLNVPGATGYIDTNYEGKVEFALSVLERKDFVVVHVEAPDEAGHQGNLEHKVQAIEDFDMKIVGPVLEGIEKYREYRVLALPDHPTPLALKTHTSDPVPFVLCTEKMLRSGKGSAQFSEKEAAESGCLEEDCKVFMEEFFGRPEQVCDLKE